MPARLLLVTADDFGIGPETSRGILDAARHGSITSTVMLVNSPFASKAVCEWKNSGRPLELGWHPCLTLDSPLLPPHRVPSLVGENGRFHPLGQFLKRIVLGRINAEEVRAEFHAQLKQFIDLVGQPPANVNAHHHIHVFRVVIDALMDVLDEVRPKPFIRRVVESHRTLRGVTGARLKRAFLTLRGRAAATRQEARRFPGNQTLLGVTDPQYVSDPEFFARWLALSTGDRVELACHPGHADSSLAERDADPHQRRSNELRQLLSPDFLVAVEKAGFKLATAAEMVEASRNEGSPQDVGSLPAAATPPRSRKQLGIRS